ncbi:MAG: hypothetical protein HY329_01700 [Chloroflexi bacterium]|nr:hypothetical protein [Chloroflexota bacterium]
MSGYRYRAPSRRWAPLAALVVFITIAGALYVGYVLRDLRESPKIAALWPAHQQTRSPGPKTTSNGAELRKTAPDRDPTGAPTESAAAPVLGPPPAPDRALPDGHFYTQAAGGDGVHGFGVTDAAGAPIWSEYRRLGGPGTLGYPVSGRFERAGVVVQVFERGAIQASNGTASPVNLLDLLSVDGYDQILTRKWAIPARVAPEFDAGLSRSEPRIMKLALV